MNKRLQVVIEHYKTLKDAEQREVEVVFSLSVPYGVPYDLAFAALDEMLAELKEMQKINDSQKASQESVDAEVVS